MLTVRELFDLTDQVAIVTGGAGRLGSQMCDALAEAGAHVVVASRQIERCQRKAEELSVKGPEALARTVDVTAPESWRQLVKEVTDKFRKVDILVNNAYSGRANRFEEMTLEDFESATRGALSSVFLGSQAVAPFMQARHKGTIINVSSLYGAHLWENGSE